MFSVIPVNAGPTTSVQLVEAFLVVRTPLLALLLASGTLHGGSCPTFRFQPPRDLVPLAASVVRVVDVTGDARADIVALDAGGTVTVDTQQPDGRFSRATLSTPSAFDLVVGDVDGDGRADAVLLFAEGPRLLRVAGDGGLSLGPPPVTSPPRFSQGRSTTFADLDGDGRQELLVTLDDALCSWRAGGSGAFELTRLATVPGGATLIAGDFDGDGHQDVVAATAFTYLSGRESRLLRGDGHGGLTPGPAFPLPQITSVATGDFDGDGRADFAFGAFVTTPESFHVTGGLALGAAGAPLSLRPAAGLAATPSDAVLPADAAGERDVVLAVRAGVTTILRGRADGTLAGAGGLAHPGSRAVAFADVDGDGWPDLVLLGDGRLQVARNLCGEIPDQWVPALVSMPGAGGARYDTELTLDNPSLEPLVLDLRYVPSIGDGGGRATLTLPAGGQRVLRPALDALASLGIPIPPTGPRAGSLAIRALSGPGQALAVSARITSATADGVAGVGFGGTGPGFGGNGAVVGWLRETGGDRSNLALLNLGLPQEGDVSLLVRLYSTDPPSTRPVSLDEIRLAPGERVQLDRVLARIPARAGYAVITRTSGQAPFYAYGVVNDEATSDGSFVPPMDQARRPASRYTVPAIVESARYTSDLVVTHAISPARSIAFRLVADALTTPDHTVRFTREVPASGQLYIPDLVDSLRRDGVDGIPPKGTDVSGALFAEVESPTALLFLGARTSAAKGEGRYGVFTEAVADHELARFAAFVPAVRQDGEVRTNVAVVNAGTSEARYTITAIDPETSTATGSRLTVTLGPGERAQVDSVLRELGTDLRAGRVVISVDGVRPAPFLAYGIVHDGAATGAGSGDATYLRMVPID